jgi:hypothetical protein
MIYNYDFFIRILRKDEFISLPYSMSALYIRDGKLCECTTCSQASHGQYDIAYFYLVFLALLHQQRVHSMYNMPVQTPTQVISSLSMDLSTLIVYRQAVVIMACISI